MALWDKNSSGMEASFWDTRVKGFVLASERKRKVAHSDEKRDGEGGKGRGGEDKMNLKEPLTANK